MILKEFHGCKHYLENKNSLYKLIAKSMMKDGGA
jgi:hypothetical protein